MLYSGVWPDEWKLEYVTPIGKKPYPESEDDLRPISLTPFFSKVAEKFVSGWLLDYIGDKLDFRQYGGLKGNSTTHYIIELVNCILAAQDSADQTAVLACLVDFSKAFNRQDHNILITKLCDMDVPGWLLRLIKAFLENRRLVVRYKGKLSSIKSLPEGGPQGTVLALLLFLVLVNDVGFHDQTNNVGELVTSKRSLRKVNEIHLKFVDDLTLAESINLNNTLEYSSLGNQLHLPASKSKVHDQLIKTQHYADNNKMKINFNKTKLILFNPCTSLQFKPDFSIDSHKLSVEDQVKLLGVTISSNMKWNAHIEDMVTRANKKLWILRRLSFLGASQTDLLDIYTKQIRSILEYAVPAWHGSTSQADKCDIERVLISACHIILGKQDQG